MLFKIKKEKTLKSKDIQTNAKEGKTQPLSILLPWQC